ncbi:MAG TPA: thiamine diphosphokinase [Ignavibacteria bacterium]|nr:thiamine diphosphokinase [Ignavibacteria bacterium]
MKNLLFLNGYIPFHVFHKLYKSTKNYIIAADGGANQLPENDIDPDIILGDLDSISPKVLNFYKKSKKEIINISEQETTDFEKALNFCIENGIKELKVFGAVSERPDHTFNNFSILKRYYKSLDVILYSNEFEIYFINKFTDFKYKKNNTVSLMPFPKAISIITEGLKYKLSEEDLVLGKREGSLNLSNAERVKISFSKGDLLLFKKHFIHNPKI